MGEIVMFGEKTIYPIIFPSNYNGLGSINCYIYKNGLDYTLIDAGIQTPEFEAFFFQKLIEYNIELAQINRIILTHFHADHIGMVNGITKKYNIPLYASKMAIPRLKCEQSYLRQKIDFYNDLYAYYDVSDFSIERMAKMEKTLQNKEQVMIHCEILSLSEEQKIAGLEVVASPGHTPDSICLFDRETGWLLAGDFLLETGITNALVDHDELGQLINPITQYLHSIDKVKALPISKVFAGHQNPFGNIDVVIQNSLSKIEYKLQKILKKIAEGNNTARKLGEELYGPRFAQFFTFIISEIIGLTLLAEQRGYIKREWQDGQWYFTIMNPILN